MNVATIILNCIYLYAAIGSTVAASFLLFGIDRIDDGAHGTYAFRPLLFPGLVLLWPFILWRWYSLARRPKTCGNH